MPFVFHYLWWSHAFFFFVLPPCCWELCTACSGAAMLRCLLNQQSSHSRCSQAQTGTTCQGLFWWHHHCCHSHCEPSPLGKEVSWAAAHACLLVPLPNTEVSPIRSPCSVALQQQIILDDFILITFSLIFFYLYSTMPHWLQNTLQVGAHMALWAHASIHNEHWNTQWHFEQVYFCIIWKKTWSTNYAAWAARLFSEKTRRIFIFFPQHIKQAGDSKMFNSGLTAQCVKFGQLVKN